MTQAVIMYVYIVLIWCGSDSSHYTIFMKFTIFFLWLRLYVIPLEIQVPTLRGWDIRV